MTKFWAFLELFDEEESATWTPFSPKQDGKSLIFLTQKDSNSLSFFPENFSLGNFKEQLALLLFATTSKHLKKEGKKKKKEKEKKGPRNGRKMNENRSKDRDFEGLLPQFYQVENQKPITKQLEKRILEP